MSFGVIRNSIVLKLWLTIVAMVVFVFLLLSVLLQQFLANYVWQQQTPQLVQTATMAEYLVGQGQALSVAQLGRIHHATIQYGPLSPLGKAIRGPYETLSPVERQSLRSGVTLRQHIVSDGKEQLRVFLPVSDSGTIQHGVIVVSQNTSVYAQALRRMRNLVTFALLLGIVMATGLAFVISNNLSRPLVQMNSVAEDMAKGNFSGKINVVTRDEVGRLGTTFNQLVQQLAQTIETLNVERDQLRSILTSLKDGVVATDLDGNITLANPPALRRLSSIWLQDSGDPVSHRLPAELQSMLTNVIDNNGSMVREFSWQGRTIQITMALLHELNGRRVRGTVAVLRDITAERLSDRLRKDFIANVSHELRTPLSMMQGYTEALQDEFGDDPVSRRELTGIIHDETLRMRRLVNDLLDLAQLESGQFQMHAFEVDIHGLLRRVARKFQTLALEAGVTMVSEVPKSSLVIPGDEDRLEQVFTNLLDNAIRHTPRNHGVTLEVQLAGDHVRVRVTDTGTGISKEDLPYIWERFYKADKARTRGKSGIGLGLAITRQIIHLHHGDIIVESEEGKGAVFTVVLPVGTVGTPDSN